ncbi:MAG: chromate transporter [Rhodoferax sp.]|nr:chromate transporter [Rhodoferax sp.]
MAPGPGSLRELFWSFTLLALQGFGGVHAVAQRELVDNRRWLTREAFIEDWAVAQIMPGPNVVNLSIILGERYFGLRGAAMALAGMLALPILILLTMAALYGSVQHQPAAQGALRGMAAVAAGLITATGLKLIPALQANVMGPWVSAGVAALTFMAIAWLRLPLAAVLLVLGTVACGWAFRSLGHRPSDSA